MYLRTLEIYKLDAAKFPSAPASMPSSFKKDQSKIRSFNLYRYVINGRERYESKNMSLYLLICKS